MACEKKYVQKHRNNVFAQISLLFDRKYVCMSIDAIICSLPYVMHIHSLYSLAPPYINGCAFYTR